MSQRMSTMLVIVILCCFEAVASAQLHIVTRSDAAFTADGVNTGGSEYTSDDMVALSGSLHMEAQVFWKRFRDPGTGDEELRIYFSVHDIDANADDRIDLIFDPTNDGVASDDVMIRVRRVECASPPCEVRRIASPYAGSGSAVNLANARIRASEAGEYAGAGAGYQTGWTGELVLTPEDLGWGYFPALVGFLAHTRSAGPNAISAANPIGGSPSFPTASYPTNGGSVVQNTDLASYGDVGLRYPIDYSLVLDYSGSMKVTDGSPAGSRWERAKRAASLFAAVLGLFKSDILGDRIAVSQYSWNCGDDTLAGNTTGAVPGVPGGASLNALGPPPTGSGSLLGGNTDPPEGNNCTPIHRGLRTAIDQLGALTGKRDRIVVLLSDGLHNMPSGDADFANDPGPYFTTAEKGALRVHTVALGPDGSAGTELLAKIANEFGVGANTKYNNVNQFSELLAAYLDTLQEPLTINRIPEVGGSYATTSPDKLVIIGVWNDPTAALGLTVNRDGASQAPDAAYVNTGIGYSAAVYTDRTVLSGSHQWTVGPGPDAVLVLVDLRVRARFLLEQKLYGAGEPMLLQARLQDRDQPITGAEVFVEIARPGQGLGNFLSRVQRDCSLQRPKLPTGRNLSRTFGRVSTDPSHRTVGDTSAPSTATPTTLLGSGDPLVGRYRIARAHFQRCQLRGLEPRVQLPRLPLRDDGQDGDQVAGDGIYTLRFTDTGLEGTYAFRFLASGTTQDGEKFARTRTMWQHAIVKPVASATEFNIVKLDVVGGRQNAVLLVMPMDRLGNHKGPGFASLIRIQSRNATLTGDVRDMGNGIYAQPITYATSVKEPVIDVALPDGEVLEIGRRPRKGTEGFLGLGVIGFASALNLDPGVQFNARVGVPLVRRIGLYAELEGAGSLNNVGPDMRIALVFLNLRADLEPLTFGGFIPHVIAGGGLIGFSNDGGSGTTYAYHAGAGLSYFFIDSLGVRAAARVLRFGDAFSLGATTNFDVTAGVVFRTF